VRRFLQRLAALSHDEWKAVAHAFADAEGTPRFRRADVALGSAITGAGREAERDAAMRPLLQLVRAAPDAAAPGGEDGDAALDPVAPAAAAAVLALVARDLLHADHFATLYAPFAELVPAERL
jgi:hypothetical protein